jgi:FMN phosphatase YigB (HAD superfamily)
MRVGIDLDGVCYDFAASVREYLCNTAGTHDPEVCTDPQRWEFYEDWGLDLAAFLDAFHAGVDAGVIFTHGDPHTNTAEAFARIKAAGHSIHIVTDRAMGSPGASEAATAAWLDRHGLPFDSLTFSPDKTVVNLDVMVDDKLSNYDALEAAGVRAYLLTRPWNQHDPAPRRRVLDLLHFAEVIQ